MMMSGHLSKVSTKNPTPPLMDVKTIEGLFVHAIRKPPCFRGGNR